MDLPIPPVIFRDKFDSYFAVQWQKVLDVAEEVLGNYKYQEIFENTSIYHKASGMRLEKAFLVDESVKFKIFSAYNTVATRIEVEPFEKSEISRKILADFKNEIEESFFKFTRKQNMLLSLPKILVALLFFLTPLILIGGITIETLIISGLILNAVISILFANIGKSEIEKWRNVEVIKGKKPEVREDVDEEEIRYGFDESDFGWE